MGMIARTRCLCVFTLVAVAGLARPAGAQQRPDVVEGVVRSNGVRVPYAVVQFGSNMQFTDDSGAFRVPNVPPGGYRLYIRQVGFRPFDTTVVKRAGSALVVPVAMEPLVIELAAITVEVPRSCTTPGPPDSVISPQLAAVFDQLRLNAERYAFLADSYPFHLRMSRTFADYDEGGRVVWSSADTVRLSSQRLRYRPGQVIYMGTGAQHDLGKVLRMPTLADFADSTFQANHCFYYAGTADSDSGRTVLFDYVPTDAMLYPDVEGRVALDARSFEIRYATFHLTRVDRAMPGLESTSSTIRFAEVFPNIIVPMHADQLLVPEPRADVRTPIARSTETWQLLDVHFDRTLPGMAPAGP